MPIETLCQGCGKRLRVADEHAGKLAKCPQCQAVYTVPQSPVAAAWGGGAASDSPLGVGDRWHLKTPDGLTFGPVARAELDRWLAEGRITPHSQILHEGEGHWAWAAQIYPHLQAAAAPSPFKPGAMPTAMLAGGANPYADAPAAATSYSYGPYSPYREQHRGGTVLTMAIVGLVVCQFLAIAAVIMALVDLGKMKRGVMDPAGKGQTIAGLVIGSISIGIMVIWIVLQIAMNL
jgi:hypothetical protein